MATERPTSGRGSSLMLMPAAVLVVVLLGAIAVDQAAVYTRQRELVAASEAAANDAASYGLDRSAFYDRGDLRFDLRRARAAAAAALRARGIDAPAVVRLVDGGAAVEVRVERTVEYLFAKSIPGGPRSTVVHARATAELRQDGR